MIPPRDKVMVLMPTFDRRIDIGCMQGMVSCLDYFARPFFLVQQSNICLARNELAHIFLKRFTDFDWAQWIDSDIVFTREDWELLWEGDEEIVCAAYSRKVFGEPPTEFGLGFTRVHRSVYEKIENLTTDDGQDYAQRFYNKGAMMINYFPNGPNPAGRFLPEDYGFFTLASLTDVKPRLEKRTRLKHVGLHEFCYPDQIPGYTIVNEPLDIEHNKE